MITPEFMAKWSRPEDPLIIPLDGEPGDQDYDRLLLHRNLGNTYAINYALALCELEEQRCARRLSFLTSHNGLEGQGLLHGPRYSQMMRMLEASYTERTSLPKSYSAELTAAMLEDGVESLLKAHLHQNKKAFNLMGPSKQRSYKEGKDLLMRLISSRNVACLDAPYLATECLLESSKKPTVELDKLPSQLIISIPEGRANKHEDTRESTKQRETNEINADLDKVTELLGHVSLQIKPYSFLESVSNASKSLCYKEYQVDRYQLLISLEDDKDRRDEERKVKAEAERIRLLEEKAKNEIAEKLEKYRQEEKKRAREDKKNEDIARRKINKIINKKHAEGVNVLLSDLPTNLWSNRIVKVVKMRAVGRTMGVKNGLVSLRTLNKTSLKHQFKLLVLPTNDPRYKKFMKEEKQVYPDTVQDTDDFISGESSDDEESSTEEIKRK